MLYRLWHLSAGLPTFLHQPEDRNITRDTPFMLSCEAVGPPDPVQIRWLRDGLPDSDFHNSSSSYSVSGETPTTTQSTSSSLSHRLSHCVGKFLFHSRYCCRAPLTTLFLVWISHAIHSWWSPNFLSALFTASLLFPVPPELVRTSEENSNWRIRMTPLSVCLLVGLPPCCSGHYVFRVVHPSVPFQWTRYLKDELITFWWSKV